MKKELKHFIFLTLLVVFFTSLFFHVVVNYDIAGMMINFVQDYYNLFGELGVYFAILLLSVIGNFTIVFPVPYLIAVMTSLLILPVSGFIIIIVAGIVAGIGELSAWFLGKLSHKVIKNHEKSFHKNVELLKELIKKGFGFPLIVLFAATPLPDDVLLVLLGSAHYPLLNALIAALIGKVIMIGLLVTITELTALTEWGRLLLSLYGLNLTEGEVGSTDSIISNLFIIGTIVLLFLFFNYDWSNLFKREK